MSTTAVCPDFGSIPTELSTEVSGINLVYLTSTGKLVALERLDGSGKREWFNAQGQRHDYVDKSGIRYPAVQWKNGSHQYYSNDKLHNLDGPAVVWRMGCGDQYQYFVNGLCHREDGPAKVSAFEHAYYQRGELLRVEYSDGRCVAYRNGLPAVYSYKNPNPVREIGVGSNSVEVSVQGSSISQSFSFK